MDFNIAFNPPAAPVVIIISSSVIGISDSLARDFATFSLVY